MPEKRQLLNFVVSNLRVDGETLHPIYKKPFDLLAKGLERPNWLPRSYRKQTVSGRLNENLVPNSFFFITDRSPFEYCKSNKGHILHLLPLEAESIRRLKHRDCPPKAPAIKGLLQRGVGLRFELNSRPGLRRSDLARELHLDPSRVTQILNLLNLAPEIQDYIRNLLPTKHRSPISDEDWMKLARLGDRDEQLKEFERLLQSMERQRSIIVSDVSSRQPNAQFECDDE